MKEQELNKLIIAVAAWAVFWVFLQALVRGPLGAVVPQAAAILMMLSLAGVGWFGKAELHALVGSGQTKVFDQVNMVCLCFAVVIALFWWSKGGPAGHGWMVSGSEFLLRQLQVVQIAEVADLRVWLWWLVWTTILGPIIEEIAFVVVLGGALFKLVNRWLAIGVLSFAFVLCHDFWSTMPISGWVFLMGRMGASLYLFSEFGNARPGIWLHILGNIFAVGHIVGG